MENDIHAWNYWSHKHPTDCNFQRGPGTDIAVEVVKSLCQPKDLPVVFEFGCGVGRNLVAVRDECRATVCGLDCNLQAIEKGAQLSKVPLYHGSGQDLLKLPDEHFDITFCVSALSHVTSPLEHLGELLRISRVAFFCMEPYIEGQHGVEAESPPFTWYYDWPQMFADLDATVHEIRPTPLWPEGAGPTCHLFVVRKNDGPAT